MEIIFGLAMLTSALVGRVTLLAMRGHVHRPLNQVNAVRDVIGFLAGLCFWVLILWGFSSLDWYYALPIILGAGFLGGMLANPPRFAFFFAVEPVLDVLTLGMTLWLWFAHWPY
ncbi:hypothetical protein [Qipengyuania qiaonensis]|uniref:Uncharacterized protein n=1 Tax=Qipengyuania qiaonensis TaxID=2867240 RepID=A0ABS7J6L2_9SPHN|nr:hypothetical protein [Qipengyuania qiaonensis]MBX7482960.1 hypothetical protein [Qipengyuania qiaonensis]